MNEVRDLYFNIKTDVNGTKYLQLRDNVKSYRNCKNTELIKDIENLLNDKQYNDFTYVKGLRICFTLNNNIYVIMHQHQPNDLIHNIIERLKYHNVQKIFIKYGEID